MFTRTLWPDHSHILTNHSHVPCSLAHYDWTTRTSPHSHITVLAHSIFTCTLWPDHSHISNHSHITALAHHRSRTSPHSHIMTEPLAHFDSHITNHSHIPCSLAHYDRTTRTSPLSHIMTEPLAHFMLTRTLWLDHSHIITGSLAHNQSLAHHCSLLELAHFDSHITNHSHITALAHYDWTTCTSLYSNSHIPCSLAHFDTHITNHSHIALLAHSMFTRTLWPDHSHITALARHRTRTFRLAHNQSLAHYDRNTCTLAQLTLAHSSVAKTRPLAHSGVVRARSLAHWPN